MLLPGSAPEEREVFALLDSTAAGEFALFWVLVECIELLEACLNGTNEFGRRMSLMRKLKRQGLSDHRVRLFHALCEVLGCALFQKPSARGDPTEQVAELWRKLIAGVHAAELGESARAITLVLPRVSHRLPHVDQETRRISDGFAKCPQEVKAFGYHGSIGSNDHVRWLSDCDAVLILSEGVVQDAGRLRRLRPAFLNARRMMTRMYHFQHH